MDITDNPDSLAYHIKRSVPHDSLTVTGNLLFLTRGSQKMVCLCGPGQDVRVSVNQIDGELDWIRTWANDTDTIARLWTR